MEKGIPARMNPDEVAAHFRNLPDRYFRIHTAGEIAEDLGRVHKFLHRQARLDTRLLEPILSWKSSPNRGYTVLKIVSWDYARIFSRLAGALTASGIQILGAQIFTRADSIVLDTFTLVDAVSGALITPSRRELFQETATRILSGESEPKDLIAHAPRTPPLYHCLEGEQIPPRVEFDNRTSEQRTIVDIEAEDRPGLLYFLTAAFNEMELDISFARISTERGAAIDSFYVRDRNGRRSGRRGLWTGSASGCCGPFAALLRPSPADRQRP